MVRRSIFLGLVLLAGCARSEDASVVADLNELQPVERVRTPEQDDEQVAIGNWRETLQEDESSLEFGPTGTPPLFSLRCNARRSVFLQRHGTIPTGDLPMMLVSIGSETRRLAVTASEGPVPMLRASLSPSDTLLRSLADAAEPIMIRVGDALPLALPPNPSVGAFLGRCESGAGAVAAETDGNETEANSAAEAEPVDEAAAPAPAER
ncbi:hypothetical protein [Sphingosinicella sp. CPCC 101087]|uniref:hypothetical protein n=1 Tax=Sphingosinicella sp. CPCC 101087 TaxID=2497754 RepID=UPI00101DF770|nr:hypothetical protein [Sphingosinicella sp. CPCC 101087]